MFFFSMSLYPFHGTIDVMSDDPMTIELPFKNFVLIDQARGRFREKIVKLRDSAYALYWREAE